MSKAYFTGFLRECVERKVPQRDLNRPRFHKRHAVKESHEETTGE
jgi:hypothetical protein